MPHVQLGAAPDQDLEGGRVARGEGVPVLDEPVEERLVADERDLHRFRHPGDLVAAVERLEEAEVVQDGERRREGAEEVLLPERVDRVLDADARVVLGEDRDRDADHAHAAVRRRGRVTDGVLERAAADAQDERLAVQADVVHAALEVGDQRLVVLRGLASLHHDRLGDEGDPIGVRGEVVADPVDEPRPGGQDLRLDDGEDPVAPPRLALGEGGDERRVGRVEQVAREVDDVPELDGEALDVDGRARAVGLLRPSIGVGRTGVRPCPGIDTHC